MLGALGWWIVFNFCFLMPVCVFTFMVIWLQVFKGNENTYLAELRTVSPPIIAKRIRFIPYSQHPRTVCMRVEMYGCEWKGKIEFFFYLRREHLKLKSSHNKPLLTSLSLWFYNPWIINFSLSLLMSDSSFFQSNISVLYYLHYVKVTVSKV